MARSTSESGGGAPFSYYSPPPYTFPGHHQQQQSPYYMSPQHQAYPYYHISPQPAYIPGPPHEFAHQPAEQHYAQPHNETPPFSKEAIQEAILREALNSHPERLSRQKQQQQQQHQHYPPPPYVNAHGGYPYPVYVIPGQFDGHHPVHHVMKEGPQSHLSFTHPSTTEATPPVAVITPNGIRYINSGHGGNPDPGSVQWQGHHHSPNLMVHGEQPHHNSWSFLHGQPQGRWKWMPMDDPHSERGISGGNVAGSAPVTLREVMDGDGKSPKYVPKENMERALSSTSIDPVQKFLSLLFPQEEALEKRDLDGKGSAAADKVTLPHPSSKTKELQEQKKGEAVSAPQKSALKSVKVIPVTDGPGSEPKPVPVVADHGGEASTSVGVKKQEQKKPQALPKLTPIRLVPPSDLARKKEPKKISGNSKAGSREESPVKKLQRPTMDTETAAKKVQSAYKGYMVRRCQPLKHLREIARVKSKLEEYRALASNKETYMDPALRLRLTEGIMSLLLQLDGIQGVDPVVRDIRKFTSKEVLKLQNEVDRVITNLDNDLQDTGKKDTQASSQSAVQNTEQSANLPPGHSAEPVVEEEPIEILLQKLLNKLQKPKELEEPEGNAGTNEVEDKLMKQLLSRLSVTDQGAKQDNKPVQDVKQNLKQNSSGATDMMLPETNGCADTVICNGPQADANVENIKDEVDGAPAVGNHTTESDMAGRIGEEGGIIGAKSNLGENLNPATSIMCTTEREAEVNAVLEEGMESHLPNCAQDQSEMVIAPQVVHVGVTSKVNSPQDEEAATDKDSVVSLVDEEDIVNRGDINVEDVGNQNTVNLEVPEPEPEPASEQGGIQQPVVMEGQSEMAKENPLLVQMDESGAKISSHETATDMDSTISVVDDEEKLGNGDLGVSVEENVGTDFAATNRSVSSEEEKIDVVPKGSEVSLPPNCVLDLEQKPLLMETEEFLNGKDVADEEPAFTATPSTRISVPAEEPVETLLSPVEIGNGGVVADEEPAFTATPSTRISVPAEEPVEILLSPVEIGNGGVVLSPLNSHDVEDSTSKIADDITSAQFAQEKTSESENQLSLKGDSQKYEFLNAQDASTEVKASESEIQGDSQNDEFLNPQEGYVPCEMMSAQESSQEKTSELQADSQIHELQNAQEGYVPLDTKCVQEYSQEITSEAGIEVSLKGESPKIGFLNAHEGCDVSLETTSVQESLQERTSDSDTQMEEICAQDVKEKTLESDMQADSRNHELLNAPEGYIPWQTMWTQESLKEKTSGSDIQVDAQKHELLNVQEGCVPWETLCVQESFKEKISEPEMQMSLKIDSQNHEIVLNDHPEDLRTVAPAMTSINPGNTQNSSPSGPELTLTHQLIEENKTLKTLLGEVLRWSQWQASATLGLQKSMERLECELLESKRLANDRLLKKKKKLVKKTKRSLVNDDN